MSLDSSKSSRRVRVCKHCRPVLESGRYTCTCGKSWSRICVKVFVEWIDDANNDWMKEMSVHSLRELTDSEDEGAERDFSMTDDTESVWSGSPGRSRTLGSISKPRISKPIAPEVNYDLDMSAHASGKDWMPNSESKTCLVCDRLFSIVRRRHHCRSCGSLVCKNCSSGRACLPNSRKRGPVRVCDRCYGEIGAHEA